MRILIIKLSTFGDIVIADGAMRAVRQNFPEAHISLFIRPLYADFLKAAPYIDDIITFAYARRWRLDKTRALKRIIDAMDVDLIVDLQNNRRSRQILKWFRARKKPPKISGLSKSQRGFATAQNERIVDIYDEHKGQLRRDGLRVIDDCLPDMSWTRSSVDDILAEYGVKAPFVYLIPGSSARHTEKRWPHYADLIQRLQAQGLQCVTAPGPDELAFCKALPAITLMDERHYLSFSHLADLSAKSAAVIGNDTGAMHMAAANGAKGVALLCHKGALSEGLGSPQWLGFQRFFTVLQDEDISNISVNEVAPAVLRILSGSAI